MPITDSITQKAFEQQVNTEILLLTGKLLALSEKESKNSIDPTSYTKGMVKEIAETFSKILSKDLLTFLAQNIIVTANGVFTPAETTALGLTATPAGVVAGVGTAPIMVTGTIS